MVTYTKEVLPLTCTWCNSWLERHKGWTDLAEISQDLKVRHARDDHTPHTCTSCEMIWTCVGGCRDTPWHQLCLRCLASGGLPPIEVTQPPADEHTTWLAQLATLKTTRRRST